MKCKGFAVGRTIFHAPSRAWLAGEIDDAALVRRVRDTYEALIDAWVAAKSGQEDARIPPEGAVPPGTAPRRAGRVVT